MGGGRCRGLSLSLDFIASKCGDEVCGWIVDGGDDEPYMELNVEEDLVVGTVPVEPLESFKESSEDLSLLKLALERRRRSLKNGIWSTIISYR